MLFSRNLWTNLCDGKWYRRQNYLSDKARQLNEKKLVLIQNLPDKIQHCHNSYGIQMWQFQYSNILNKFLESRKWKFHGTEWNCWTAAYNGGEVRRKIGLWKRNLVHPQEENKAQTVPNVFLNKKTLNIVNYKQHQQENPWFFYKGRRGTQCRLTLGNQSKIQHYVADNNRNVTTFLVSIDFCVLSLIL